MHIKIDFCLQELVCNECVVVEHKQPLHAYERIADLEEGQKGVVKALVTECKAKVTFCEEATTALENALSEVQMQRDNARGQIEETFQTYRTMLEAKKVTRFQFRVGSFSKNLPIRGLCMKFTH